MGNIECLDENECKYLHRLLNVLFKRYYVNDFGGIRLRKIKHDVILKVFQLFLEHSRRSSYDIVSDMEIIDDSFCESTDIEDGQIYIIDNVTTIKVGAAKNAQIRFDGLIRNGELSPQAKLKVVYEVPDEFGFEAKAQAVLNQYKAQNPNNAGNRNALWGALDEHFSCSVEIAMNEIEKKLNGQYKAKTMC